MTARTLRFRQLEVGPDDPVESWGVEGILTAIDRGGLEHWRTIMAAVRRAPEGTVAADLGEALEIAESAGVAAALQGALERARGGERVDVAQRVRSAVRRSGLTSAAFAEALGTSASRLSTYANGGVVPSAALLQRIDRESRVRAVLVTTVG